MGRRVLTILIGAPVVFGAILWSGGAWPFPGWPLALFVLALTLKGLHEFYRGCRTAEYTPRDGFGYGAALLLLFAATPLVPELNDRIVRLGVTALLLASLAWEALRRDRAPLKSLPVTWLGALYVGWLFPYALRLRLASPAATGHLGWTLPGWAAAIEPGAWLLFFTILLTNAADTGAYLVGKSIGKHKMAPAVSPGKTWEGTAGGYVTALLAGALGAWLLRLPMGFALVAAALIGVMAVLGDLSKSAIKREIGIKDFGRLLPGHGGVLDRFDSLLFTAPTVYWLLDLW